MSVLIPSCTTTPALSGQKAARSMMSGLSLAEDRILKTLLRKEDRYLPARSTGRPVSCVARYEVCQWMRDVCDDRGCRPDVFGLATNYLDRFLAVCRISLSQLQLLAAVSLMVACKVRGHKPLSAMDLVEYSDFNLALSDIVEWEVLLLSKLDWDVCSVISFDFVDLIFQRLAVWCSPWDFQLMKSRAESLAAHCCFSPAFIWVPASLVASACVLSTLKSEPSLDSDNLLQLIEDLTFISKDCIEDCLMRISALKLPDSPKGCSQPRLHEPRPRASSDGGFRGRRLFAKADTDSTPTKVLDVVRD